MIGQYLSKSKRKCYSIDFPNFFETKQGAGASAGGVGQREREQARWLLVGLGVPRHDPRRGA